jgi:DNA-binding transcriptional LysR family regulator
MSPLFQSHRREIDFGPGVSEDYVARHLTSGRLVRVLEDWCQPFPGFFLYYPNRRNQPATRSALINALRLRVEP